MPTSIANNAVVDPSAQIGDEVEIGPFCVIGPDVKIGDGTRLDNSVTLCGHVHLGQRNHLYPGVVIGAEPQDLSFRGGGGSVVVGDHNVIRESVTINRGSEKDRNVTRVGNRCYLMAGCHVAHDCMIDDHVVIANSTMLGGHVHVHEHATLSGLVGIHHFTTIGRYSFVAGMSRVRHDVPPFMLAEGSPSRPRCVNVVALKRKDFSSAVIKALSEAHRLIYRSKVGVDQARELLRGNGQFLPHVNELFDFIDHQQEGRHGRARELRSAA